jgi:hypothetical protein
VGKKMETPCGYTFMPKGRGKKDETPCGYTFMPKGRGQENGKGKTK